MKTTFNIPDERMEALLKATKAKTRTEAINTAIEEYIYQESVKKVMDLAGTGGFMPNEDLQALRQAELNETAANYPSK